MNDNPKAEFLDRRVSVPLWIPLLYMVLCLALLLFGIGSVVSVNLRSMTAHYEALEHPEPAVVAARRIGKAIGRSEGWVNAVARRHCQGIAAAKAELGGKMEEV